MAIYTNEEQDGNLIDNSAKKELITEIKEIISEYGGFGTGEVQASYSPSVPNQKGNLDHLIERFNLLDVEVDVYDDEVEVDNYTLTYDDLDEETLEYILELAQAYKEIQEEENF